jgi:hypothetical protein
LLVGEKEGRKETALYKKIHATEFKVQAPSSFTPRDKLNFPFCSHATLQRPYPVPPAPRVLLLLNLSILVC